MDPLSLDKQAADFIKELATNCEANGLEPVTISETALAMSALIQGGFSADSLGRKNIDKISNYLAQNLRGQGGLLGTIPSAVVDADNTAKSILTLKLLSKDEKPGAIISFSKTDGGYFRTSLEDHKASFTENCIILQALLGAPNAQDHESEIVKIALCLCKIWKNGVVKDKWNMSVHYSMMLLSQALVSLLSLWSSGVLISVPENLLKAQIPEALIQILSRTMFSQHLDGSWGNKSTIEATAYAIITLKELSTLSWTTSMAEELHSAVQAGQHFLMDCHESWTEPRPSWTGNVSYGNPTVVKSYCLAAMISSQPARSWKKRIEDIVDIPVKDILKSTHIISLLPAFKDTDSWKLKISAIEGLLLLPQLKSTCADILPCQKDAKNSYLDLVPITWILGNNINNLFLPTQILLDMMIMTVLVFRIDEYIETTLSGVDDILLQQTRTSISQLCAINSHKLDNSTTNRPREHSTGAIISDYLDYQGKKFSLAAFEAVIGHYIEVLITYPSIEDASRADKSLFATRLEEYLKSHIDQIEDNKRFAGQASRSTYVPTAFETPRSSFLEWLQTTGSDSVSVPMGFAFLICLIGASVNVGNEERKDVFTTIDQKHIANDLCERLASMSRLYNDFGSMRRDCLEANINSVNFAEFHNELTDIESPDARQDELKRKLLVLAEYERKTADYPGRMLIETLETSRRAREEQIARAVVLFISTVDLYAELSVVKDVSNPVKH